MSVNEGTKDLFIPVIEQAYWKINVEPDNKLTSLLMKLRIVSFKVDGYIHIQGKEHKITD